VVSTLALFLALGGASYAAFHLPGNSVGTRQIRDHAVTLQKISATAQHALRGQNGLPGPPGRDGAAIVARVRSSAGVDTPADHSTATVPLTSNTWTQAATEVDLGPVGRLTFTDPATGSCGGTGLADLNVEIDVDGRLFTSFGVQALIDGATHATHLTLASALYEPGVPTAHTVTAKVSSGCESGPFPADFRVTDMEFDIIRAS
jgi:hypothetical protein